MTDTDPRVEAAARALAEVDDRVWSQMNAALREDWRRWARNAIAAADRAAWRPISEAPKDGTRITLAVAGGRVWPQCWWRKMQRVPDRWESFIGRVPINPTHWMPLPSPPESSEA